MKKLSFLLFFALISFGQLIEPKGHKKQYVYNSSIQPWTIIWDLGDTLLRADKFAMAQEIGLGKFMSYIFKERKNPTKIKTLIFDVLNSLKKHPESKWLPEHNGEILPAIMTDWFNGTEPSDSIIKKALEKTESLDKEGYFSSLRERELTEDIIKTMFDPIILSKNQTPIKKMVKVVDLCSCVVDKNCKPIHRLMVFSNWDPVSSDLILASEKCKSLFSYFAHENIIISGKLGLSKPDPESFKKIIKDYNLDPSRCIFIDDIDKNLEAAELCGMCIIKVESRHAAKKIIKKLKCLCVLPS